MPDEEIGYHESPSEPIENPPVDLGASSAESDSSENVIEFDHLYMPEEDPSPFLLPDLKGLGMGLEF